MPDQEPDQAERPVTLGEHLYAIRNDRRLSLRQVEEATEREVSNAYLCQIENDKIKQPSPHILHALAELYSINYETLMEKAGYLRPMKSRSPSERHGQAATFADVNLTPTEEAELLRFLRFMRSGKSSHRAPG